jgi:hypothetical protein
LYIGISNFFTILWPIGEKKGTIDAYEIPNYGRPKTFNLSEVRKFSKNKESNKPSPTISGEVTSENLWMISIPSKIGKFFEYTFLYN